MLDTDKMVEEYLDNLRESGITNMFGAVPYLVAEFGFSKEMASAYLSDWMTNFGSRKKGVKE